MKGVGGERRNGDRREDSAKWGGGGAKKARMEGKPRAEKNPTCRRLITYRILSPSPSRPAKCEPK